MDQSELFWNFSSGAGGQGKALGFVLESARWDWSAMAGRAKDDKAGSSCEDRKASRDCGQSGIHRARDPV